MLKGIQLWVCYKTTFLPTGQMYFGVHATDDMSFGSPGSSDPFVGRGDKIRDLIERGAQRHHFHVEALRVGTYEDAKAFYDRIVFDYNHPLCLNEKQGAPAGVPKTPEHRTAIGEALVEPMTGNDNALGNIPPNKTPNGGKLKWFNHQGSQLQLETVDGRTPVDSLYKEWKLGALPKGNKASEAKSTKATVSSSDLG